LCSDVVTVPPLMIAVGALSGCSELEVVRSRLGEEKFTEDDENSISNSE